jgi:hypothetical protein
MLHFLHGITRHACQILTKQIFEISPYKNFIYVSPVGSDLFHADGRTNDHEKANSIFDQFWEFAKKLLINKRRQIFW